MEDAKSFQPGMFEPIIQIGTHPDETYSAFDVDFGFFTETVEDIGRLSFMGATGISGAADFDQTAIQGDFNALSHYLNLRSMLGCMDKTEGFHARINTPVTAPELRVIEPIAKLAQQIGEFTHDGVKYSPRDPRRRALESLFYMIKTCTEERRTQFSTALRPGDLDLLDFDYIKFAENGDVVTNKTLPLESKILALLNWLTTPGTIRDKQAVLGLVRRVSEVSNQQHLSLIERDIITQGYATRIELDTLYPDLPDPPNNNIRNTIRQLFGIPNYNFGQAIPLSRIRPFLTVATDIFRKVEQYLSPVYKHLTVPRYEGGTVVQLTQADYDLGLMRSEVSQSNVGVCIGTLIAPLVFGSRRATTSMQVTRGELVSLILRGSKRG
jgi:hypothetical protein